MIAVYIASPYSKGVLLDNVNRSFDVALELIDLGFAPYPPLYSHYLEVRSSRPYEVWMTLDKEWLLRCDCVLRLEGESIGADAEVSLAVENNIPVFYGISDLMAFKH